MKLPLTPAMLEALAGAVERRAARYPYNDLPGYMLRGWIFGGSAACRYSDNDPPRPWKTNWLDAWIGFYVACRMHVILRSDRERALHNHPWRYVTVILRGGYFEITHDKDGNEVRRWHGPGSVIYAGLGHFHRLELPPGGTATTLFFMFQFRQPWGFHILARDYKDVKP